jgi:hypothetical protein
MSKSFKLLLVFVCVICLAFTIPGEKEVYASVSKKETIQQKNKITFPKNVKAIIDSKCMGCHKPDSRNQKAKKKLQWEKVPKMNKEEQAHFIAEMFEVLEAGKMPPKRALERRPQMKLNLEEERVLLMWVTAEEQRLKAK